MYSLIEKQLSELSFKGMSLQWETLRQSKQLHELSLTDGLNLLLQAEADHRQTNREKRLIRTANFRYQASVAELHFDTNRGLDKGQVMQLATGEYIGKGQSVLVTGATGCGKSFVASALGYQACTQGNSTLYFNFKKLMASLKVARIDGTIAKLFVKLAKADLLIIDDFGLQKLDAQQQQDLMEVIEDRHARKSTIIISQMPVSDWYEIINERTIADAILDRLVHTSHRIELKGESRRKLS
ncbi:IS21-like element helper ATPase IstB [Persicobacter psychrovividus]|uniref:Transposase n=1 Tax=Persicobacter psychrovividus TaxID=387638 RepID=A0ABM7VK46_9BACT|nr:transposase [Persicobacter psychrovividus]BDD01307.1 transposase [Persicobacter psychrovividus]BDD01360.1 transposase [Persicobacter psychrovividus]BDD02441.1 transposase [Persicobacter psychrovividus]